MNKVLLIIAFLGNSCFAAEIADEFFRVAKEKGATKGIVGILASVANTKDGAKSMRMAYMNPQDVCRSDFVSVLESGILHAYRSDEGMEVRLTIQVTQDFYEEKYGSDSFTKCVVLAIVSKEKHLGVDCTSTIPLEAFRQLMDGKVELVDLENKS